MQQDKGLSRRRMLGGGAAAVAAVAGFPMINLGQYRLNAASPKTYSKRAVDLVRKSLVIDMLAPIKLDFRPEYFAAPLSEKDAAEFRASGITGFHNAVGVGGADARSSVLEWMNAWQGFAGRNSHVFSLVGLATDLDRAKKFFRKRAWIREFFDRHGVRAGDMVTVEEVAPYSYRVALRRLG